MDFLKRIIYILTITVTTYSSALSQGYMSKYVPLDFLPNTMHFEHSENRYVVYSINVIDGVSSSTIIEIDNDLEVIDTTTIPNYFYGRFGPKKYEDQYYAYGADQTNRERHILIQMDENFQEIKRDSFYPENRSFNANCMTMMSDKIIGGSWDYIECPEQNDGKCEYMNYKIIDTDGNELNSIDIGRGHPYFFSFEVDHTEEGDIICGGNRQGGGTRATVYNFDPEGSINWSYDSPDIQSRNNVPVYVEELSNGNIVYTDKLDKSWDDEYLGNGWTIFPAQLVWLSSDGEKVFSHLETLNWKSGSEFSGLLRGRGDYFFVYGTQTNVDVETDELLGNYGTLMKWSNDGELLWKRLFKHDFSVYTYPTVNHIIEHENGDISTLGSEVTDTGYFMWMTRLNEHGCLDDVDCDMPMVLPTKDKQNGNSENFMIYPNPSHNLLNIKSEQVPESVEIWTVDGTRLLSNFKSSEVQIGHLPKGLYILRAKFKDYIVRRSFVKN